MYLECKRCKNIWEYKGKKTMGYVSCPACYANVKVCKENMVDEPIIDGTEPIKEPVRTTIDVCPNRPTFVHVEHPTVSRIDAIEENYDEILIEYFMENSQFDSPNRYTYKQQQELGRKLTEKRGY